MIHDLTGIRHRPRDWLKSFLLLAAGAPFLVGGAAAAAFFVFPLPAIVPAPTAGSQAQTSHVFSSDGGLIASFHSEHNRELIPVTAMPIALQQAVVASEDNRFYEHRGVDLKAIGRALLADFKAGRTVQGGSTITQQYVKNAYIDVPQRNILRKVREALLASQVERTYTKKKILENYLNTVYLGKGAYGVEAAAKTYFGKPASKLDLSESAFIVGLIPGPVKYSPYENMAGAEERRLFVLKRMQGLHFIDAPTADAARAETPKVIPFKQEVFAYPWFVSGLKRDLIARFGEARVFAGGLQIHTTIDPKMQADAEKVLNSTLDKPKDPSTALVSIEPATGYVKAMVGGRPTDDPEGFNLATQARRQPGSSFKPFVLLAALEKGIKPSSTYDGPGSLCPKGWPKDGCPVDNYGGSGYGRITVEQATIHSVNTVYAQMIVDVTPRKIVEVAHRMGIRTNIRPFHAIGLGSENVTVFEQASAYATLAAGGIYHEPRFFSRILDKDGVVVASGPSPPKQVIDPNIAFKATEILRKVITSGTGTKANIGRPAAGKTGTATAFRNAWFCGYTPDLATAIWMGYKSNESQSMVSVHGVRNVAGGTIPAEMWAAYMKLALADIAPSEFQKAGPINVRSDEQTGFRLPPRSYFPRSPDPSPSPEETYSPEPVPSEGPTSSPVPTPTPTASIGLPG
ncbi:MAG: PBP1A family penicillin-binding protein [Actinobacteria bacterium]|nr:PBP1A family penicillin-binding protein [Actinomycetota bacterium]